MSDTAQGRIVLHDLDRGAATPPGAISPGAWVRLNFALTLAEGASSGEVIDDNFDKAPVSFVVGDGSLLPGFEQVLFGLVAGDSRDLLLSPAQAFGVVNEENVQRFPLYQFAPDLALVPGLMIEFADAAGNRQAGTVRHFDKQWVEVDFNHPLAGRTLRFRVQVHEVRAPSTDQVQTP